MSLVPFTPRCGRCGGALLLRDEDGRRCICCGRTAQPPAPLPYVERGGMHNFARFIEREMRIIAQEVRR